MSIHTETNHGLAADGSRRAESRSPTHRRVGSDEVVPEPADLTLDEFARYQLSRWTSPVGRHGKSITEAIYADIQELEQTEPSDGQEGTRIDRLRSLLSDGFVDTSGVQDPYEDKFQQAFDRALYPDQSVVLHAIHRLHLVSLVNQLGNQEPSMNVYPLVKAVIKEGNVRFHLSQRVLSVTIV